MKIYPLSQFDAIPWPNNELGDYTKKYFAIFRKHPCLEIIANVKTEIFILCWGQKVLPITLTHPKNKSCYVNCPSEHYFSYAIEELSELKNPLLEKVLKHLILAVGGVLKALKLDQVVYVNNWLLSTNLYPELNFQELTQIKSVMQKKFPNRVVLFRSLNHFTNKQTIMGLRSLGFKKILSRQVYITSPLKPDYLKKRDFLNDQKLTQKTKYQVVEHHEIKTKDIERISELYNLLYIDKYTNLNPQFSVLFFQYALRENLLCMTALKHNNTIDAVFGYFNRNGVMTAPLFGFDTKKPSKLGLYRLLSNVLMKHSAAKGIVLNQSSGAAAFKKSRGAKPYLEYSMFIADHASLPQRIAWWVLSKIYNTLGEKILTQYEL